MADKIISQVEIGGSGLYEISAKYDSSHNEIETTYAKLNNGKIPENLLPSYVDDVIEGYYLSNKFYETNSTSGKEIVGESGKIYVGLNNNKTYRWSGSAYVEISAQIAYGTGTVAPNAHTHTVKVSGTTGSNSGNGIAAVTGYPQFSGGSGSLTSNETATNGIKYVESLGAFKAGTTPPSSATFSGTSTNTAASTATAISALTGVKVSDTASAAPGGHTHNYSKTTSITLNASTSTGTGAIKYTESISGSKPSLTGVTSFVKGITAGSGSLTSNDTTTDGIKYVQTATLTPGTTPVSSASPSITSTNSGSSGGGVSTAIASVSTDGVLTLTAAIQAASAHTHTYDKTTSITLSRGTAPSLSANTKYLHHSHTPTTSTGNGTVGISGGEYTANIKYLTATPKHETVASLSNSGTNIDAVTAIGADGRENVAPSGHTHSVTATGNITFTAGTAPSMNSATIKYLHHSHNSASLGTASTNTVASHTHTHNYGSETALRTGNNSGNGVAVLTPVQ